MTNYCLKYQSGPNKYALYKNLSSFKYMVMWSNIAIFQSRHFGIMCFICYYLNLDWRIRFSKWLFYASAFRRRRHYVFGLSVRPSVRSLKYPLLTCTWVRWSTQPTETVLRHVCPSVRPSGEVSGHLPENAWSEWPAILHADVSWPSSELISLWP